MGFIALTSSRLALVYVFVPPLSLDGRVMVRYTVDSQPLHSFTYSYLKSKIYVVWGLGILNAQGRSEARGNKLEVDDILAVHQLNECACLTDGPPLIMPEGSRSATFLC